MSDDYQIMAQPKIWLGFGLQIWAESVTTLKTRILASIKP